MNLNNYIKEFFDYITENSIEIYNEFALQFELAIYLRQKCNSKYKVQLERNISILKDAKENFNIIEWAKKEIDIIIYKEIKDLKDVSVIELKAIVNQAHARPVTIFNWIEDIKLLEQLRDYGLKECYSIFLTDHRGFTSFKKDCGNLLSDFRKKEIKGKYCKHKKSKNKVY